MIHKDGRPIATMIEWFDRAPPKSSSHWQDGRSAKESARAWLTAPPGSLPHEIADVLRSHADLGPVLEWSAEPEALVAFDAYSGPANVDVLMVCRDSHGPLIVAVEAKADETFGNTIAQQIAAAEREVMKNPRSKRVARIEELGVALLGVTADDLQRVGALRYQLVTLSASVLAEAERQGATRAVVLVHEFVTTKTKDEKHERNARDLQLFWAHLSGAPNDIVGPGVIRGPVGVPGALGRSVRLYVGKAVRLDR